MKIAVIGCGVMGKAFAKHFARHHTVILCDRDRKVAETLAREIGAIFQEKPAAAIRQADVVLLAIKPKDLGSFAKEGASAFKKDKILISILTGASLKVLKGKFPKATVVRTMPNLALACGEGVIGLVEEKSYTKAFREKIESLFAGMGLLAWMSEEKIEPLIAISGSGIGFVLVIIEAMIDGGVHLGFSATDARAFVLKTLEGAVALMKESGKHPAELKLRISSPGGTTMAGLKVMEEQGVRAGILKTLIASYEKGLQMMKSL